MTNAWRSTLIPLAAISALACGAKSASSSQADASDPPAAGAASSGASTDASFTATIDGVPVTGHGVDEMQQQNAAYVLPRQGTGDKYALFILYSTKDGTDGTANYSLRLRLPPHTGTYIHAGSFDSCKCDITLNKNLHEGQLARYWANVDTITITSMSATRITGAFSGTFKLSDDTPRATQKTAKVTGGTFDIPMSTSNITPE